MNRPARLSFWKLNTKGQVVSRAPPVGATPWEIVGAPYFDGRNGLPEILWYNTQTGLVGIWRVNGTSISFFPIAVPGTQWTINQLLAGINWWAELAEQRPFVHRDGNDKDLHGVRSLAAVPGRESTPFHDALTRSTEDRRRKNGAATRRLRSQKGPGSRNNCRV